MTGRHVAETTVRTREEEADAERSPELGERYGDHRSDDCPRCGYVVRAGLDALSRTDNKTYICSQCGTDEALEDFGIRGLTPQAMWVRTSG